MLADSVGLALLVVLDTLPPAERVAFVLHDTFGLPFGEIASITGRSPAAARQLASRGRRRIQGTGPDADPAAGARLARQRKVTEAFMAASRGGDLEGADRRAGPRRGAALGRGGVAVRRPADGPRRGRGGRRGAGRLGARPGTGGSPWSTGLPA